MSAQCTVTPTTENAAAVPPSPPSASEENGEGAGAAAGEGEKLSKNAQKRLLKSAMKTPKEAKPTPAPAASAGAGEGAAVEKKEKKVKVVKEPEVVFVDQTPEGEKKIMGEMPPSYQPAFVEAAWYEWWEKCGYFTPSVEAAAAAADEDKFTIVIPPPNVTGSLHLGHALTGAIEDTLTRWHRMRGDVTLYLPGTDHAGIATQTVVEKKLKKDEGLSRHDVGREEFVKKVWDWKGTYGDRICKQIRRLGSSVDWTREAFTMDENLSRAVTEAFCKFHEDGLLYRATRLVNWSCALKSAISDIEVDFIELEGRTLLAVPGHTGRPRYEFGTLTSFAYKVLANDGSNIATEEEIVVATTRLETMLGDSAVAVHPDDARYKHLHGRHVVHPFSGRHIPIVCDGVLVDMAFGTGAVKITPSHDPNDYECGKRHDLEFITILTDDGKINHHGGERFQGLMRYDARIEIEKALNERGLFRGKADNKMRLGVCSRSGDIIEPFLTPQWYVNCKSMAQQAVDAVKEGELKILPQMHEVTWYRWLDDCRDWCVSRQLWWGHRIPAYFAVTQAEEAAGSVSKNDVAASHRWIVARTKEAAATIAAEKLGCAESEVVLHQDEDVLDTWFSSGLFPMSVFGWPEKTADFDAFFPTTLLETGLDILFFWVARMVMMSLHLTGKLPFSTVYLHAMVRDKTGRKMSKSLGNVIDPLEVIYGCPLEGLLQKLKDGNLPEKEVEKAAKAQQADFPEGIPECGADALRFGLLAYTVQGRDINLDIKRVVGYRQFCNKLWNAARFAMMYITDLVPIEEEIVNLTSNPHTQPRDRFILHRLNDAVTQSNQLFTEYSFGGVTTTLYNFWLYDLCDVYLELVKPLMNDTSPEAAPARRAAQMTLYTCLERGLRLLHPIMPFVTEELWQRLPNRASAVPAPAASIMIAAYPRTISCWNDEAAQSSMESVKDLIHTLRSLRSEYNVANHIKCNVFIRCINNETLKAAVTAQSDDVATLGRASKVTVVGAEDGSAENTIPAGCCVKIVNESLAVHIELRGLIDVDAELKRLSKQKEKAVGGFEMLKKRVTASDYEQKVPEDVRQQNTEKYAQFEQELAAVEEAMAAFETLRA